MYSVVKLVVCMYWSVVKLIANTLQFNLTAKNDMYMVGLKEYLFNCYIKYRFCSRITSE